MNGEGFADALPAGTRIGPVVLERAIGQGAWGIVYEGRHDYWGRVAIKEFFPSAYARRTASNGVGSSAPQWQDAVRKGLARFSAEGQALQAIRYENVVPVLDFLEHDASAFLVMEFIEGETLISAIEAGRFRDPPAVMALGLALVRTLEAIHAKNILHRDIAPDNIMIRPDGTPVLIDFGGAAAAVANATRSTQNIVKDGYSPPEQYDVSENAAFPVGPWSDIYAAAAVLYRLVSGHEPPVSNTRLLSSGIRGQSDPLTPLKTQPASGYPASWLAAVDAALALVPASRPQSAVAWQGMFEGPPPQRQQRARWPVFAGIAAAALIAIAAFAIGHYQQKPTTSQIVAVHVAKNTPAPRALPTKRPAARPLPKRTAPAVLQRAVPKAVVASAVPLVAATPRVAYVTPRPAPVITSHVVYVQATPRVVYAPAAATAAAQLTVDPVVGSWIFGSRYSWDFAEGGYVQARNPDGSPQVGGHWSRNGDQISASFENGYSYVFTIVANATSFTAADNHGTQQTATRVR